MQHHVLTPYHPQEDGQVKVSNKEVKNIIEKDHQMRCKGLTAELLAVLWAYQKEYNMLIGMSIPACFWHSLPPFG